MKRSEIKPKLTKKCKTCGKEFKLYRTTDKYCSIVCKPKDETIKQYKPIRQVSEKQSKLNRIYLAKRIEFLSRKENQKCPVTNKQTTEVHHKMGRKGFADEWARFNNIPLIIDERFFLAVSREGHQKIELNPIWAKEMGYSLNRI